MMLKQNINELKGWPWCIDFIDDHKTSHILGEATIHAPMWDVAKEKRMLHEDDIIKAKTSPYTCTDLLKECGNMGDI